jgi:hypothetical protein
MSRIILLTPSRTSADIGNDTVFAIVLLAKPRPEASTFK